MGAFGVRCKSNEVGPHHRDAPMNGDIDPNDSICLTTIQTPMTVGHRSPRWDHNANFIAEAHESIPALCAEIEDLEEKLAAMHRRAQEAESLAPCWKSLPALGMIRGDKGARFWRMDWSRHSKRMRRCAMRSQKTRMMHAPPPSNAFR